MSKHTNSLIEATSPYLLQHAHNPVNWVEWSNEAFQRAEEEGKLVLVSIGYSACHWCHVMEHESFENEDVAALMNEHFVCIKVDREERPDVDQVYMNAVQLMTQQGGWPLNCFTLPDGRPIYGGTYFPKNQWTQVLRNLWSTYIQDPEKVEQYASKLKEGVQLSEMIEVQTKKEVFDPLVIDQLVQKWKRNFDFDNGGENRAPKFPLPNNYEFLLHYGFINNDSTVVNHVHRTLKKMARGGIYDQIGGGFSRYAVDMIWKVPHFEKMLYDNGQLLSLYAKAYQHSPDLEYKKVLKQTFDWLEREMLDKKNGGYFSALDADSEGVEGKYYTWTKEEVENILGLDFEIAQTYYNINEKGYWENDLHIPLREKSDVEIAKDLNLSVDELSKKIDEIEGKLLTVRSKRVAPGLDTKKITSWNALLIKGLIEAGAALNENKMKQAAIKTADWIMSEMWDDKSKKLYRVPSSEKSNIKGFLDDYANTVDAFIVLYEKTFDAKWLYFAREIMDSAIELFSDEKTKFFYYTENNTELIARKMEVNDNVIPSSNSIMAKNLYRLGVFFYKNEMTERAQQMLSNLYNQMPQYGSGYSNWGQLAMYFNGSSKELGIVGNQAITELEKLNQEYLPHVLFAGGTKEDIPFLEDRVKSKTTFYVCENQHCKAPVSSYQEAIELIVKT